MKLEYKDETQNVNEPTESKKGGITDVQTPSNDETIQKLVELQKKFQDKVDVKLQEQDKYGQALGETVEQIKRMNAAIEELQLRAKRPAISTDKKQQMEDFCNSQEIKTWEKVVRSGSQEYNLRADDVEHIKSLGVYDTEKKAAQFVSDNTYGGYLVPPQVATEIIKLLYTYSDFRKYANVRTANVPEWPFLKQTGKLSATWVGETETRDTTTAATFGRGTILAHEMYCMPQESNIIIADNSFNLTSWLMEQCKMAFGEAESAAFISGETNKKPGGILKDSNITEKVSGAASALTADGLISLVYALDVRYRKNAVFIMNSSTMADIRQLKNATTNHYIWQPSLQLGEPERLLGYPCIEDANMPDVGAGTYPIVFGDLKQGYYILTRPNISTLADPYTTKGYTKFYTTIRVGGEVANAAALLKHKVAES